MKELARALAREKGRESEFAFLELLEERAIATFGRVKNNGKTVSSNIDFYSGFVYEMIGLPQEIFTPLFAMARIVGWCAHRNEELTPHAAKRLLISGALLLSVGPLLCQSDGTCRIVKDSDL